MTISTRKKGEISIIFLTVWKSIKTLGLHEVFHLFDIKEIYFSVVLLVDLLSFILLGICYAFYYKSAISTFVIRYAICIYPSTKCVLFLLLWTWERRFYIFKSLIFIVPILLVRLKIDILKFSKWGCVRLFFFVGVSNFYYEPNFQFTIRKRLNINNSWFSSINYQHSSSIYINFQYLASLYQSSCVLCHVIGHCFYLSAMCYVQELW